MYKNAGTGQNATDDQGDDELDNMADELIPSDKQEHNKNKFKVLREIYEHTERKVIQNQMKLVDL